jgi:O-antigen/teichoic acid export membrane protein
LSQSNQSAGRRLSTITIDQAIAGASNVLIAVLAARVLGVAAFGLFGIAFIIYVTAQGSSRALVCEPLLVHPVEAEERPGDAIGTAGVLGLGLGVVVVLSGVLAHVWDGRLGNALLVLGVCMPLLVLQDLGRYLGFATQQPGFSVILDAFWLVVMIGAVSVLFLTDHQTLTWFIASWAGSGAAAGLLMIWRYRKHRLRLSLSWLRETWSVSGRYLISYGATQGAALFASIGLGAIAGARALGAVRGALLLTRPMMMFQAASVAAGTVEVSRIGVDTTLISKHVRKTTALTTAVAVVNMVILLVVPDVLGRFVLGDTWEETTSVLLPAGVQIVLLGLISGTRSGLLGLRAVRQTVRIDVATTVIMLVLTLTGALMGGAPGSFWGRAIGSALVACIWWPVYLRQIRHLRTGISVATAGDSGVAADTTVPDQPVV